MKDRKGVTLTEVIVSMTLTGMLLLVAQRTVASSMRELRLRTDQISAWRALDRLMIHWRYRHGMPGTIAPWRDANQGELPGAPRFRWIASYRADQLRDRTGRIRVRVDRVRVFIVAAPDAPMSQVQSSPHRSGLTVEPGPTERRITPEPSSGLAELEFIAPSPVESFQDKQ